jgi:hypothetical protein
MNSEMPSFSKWYARGWVPLLVLLSLPIASYGDITTAQIVSVFSLAALGWAAIRLAHAGVDPTTSITAAPEDVARRHLRAAMFFAILSVIGSKLVLRDQASTLSGEDFENLQERYIALTEAALQGESNASIWSTIGNLMRAFFFVSVTSWVAYTKHGNTLLSKLVVSIVVGGALLQNFLVSVSRLQFIFYLVVAVICAGAVDHPLLRRKGLVYGGIGLLLLFLIVTSGQRFEAKFGDQEAAIGYVAPFFGVDILPLGQWLIDKLGAAGFALSVYVMQGVPELIRLIMYNPSPYDLGTHSFFLLLSPLARLFGGYLSAESGPSITNQGFWWGYMGDLYLDFGVLFPLIYVVSLFCLVKLAMRFGRGPVYGLTLRILTAGLLMIIPYTGIFNTYVVHYVVVLMLAMRESSAVKPAVSISGTAQNTAASPARVLHP